jgi:uncharacterized membrane protein YhaH (DUF805 family)
MKFQESVKTCFNQFSSFQGRASRSEYWWFALFSLIVNFVSNCTLPSNIGLIVSVIILVPHISVAIRRLHDIGKKGYWILLGLIPIAGLVLIYWFIQKSEPVANEFGEVPADVDLAQITSS